jgi:hypothetical protein
MSEAHYGELLATGKLPATAETFISPTRSFAAGYDGITVQFNMKPGALQALESLGVRDASALTTNAVGNMPMVSKGWTSTSVFFKGEGSQINLGLGSGEGLETFNSFIQSFEEVR